MNAIVPHEGFGQVPAIFNGMENDDLGAGIRMGFGVLGIRGKVWRIKHGGEEKDILQPNGDPVFSIEVVIVKAAPAISKLFYDGGYTDGSNDRPDCFSVNGVTPEPSSPKLQSKACAICPQNQMGSRINNMTGKPGRACADTKRLALVPADNIDNEAFGGPMLLRIPAASLKELVVYSNELKKRGFPYAGVVTRLKFDTNEAYPKILFNAIRALTDEEAAKVMELRTSPTVEAIVGQAAEFKEEAADTFFEQPPQKPTPVAQARPQAAPAPKPAAAPPPKPAPVQQAPQPAHDPDTGEIEEAQFTETQDNNAAPSGFGGAVPGQAKAPATAAPPKPAKAKPATAPKPAPAEAAPEEVSDEGIPGDFSSMLDDMLNS